MTFVKPARGLKCYHVMIINNKKNACGANISCGIACETINFITMAL